MFSTLRPAPLLRATGAVSAPHSPWVRCQEPARPQNWPVLSQEQRQLYDNLPISLQLLPLLNDLQKKHKARLPSRFWLPTARAEGFKGARYTQGDL